VAAASIPAILRMSCASGFSLTLLSCFAIFPPIAPTLHNQSHHESSVGDNAAQLCLLDITIKIGAVYQIPPTISDVADSTSFHEFSDNIDGHRKINGGSFWAEQTGAIY
jgi:hypothetical protein